MTLHRFDLSYFRVTISGHGWLVIIRLSLFHLLTSWPPDLTSWPDLLTQVTHVVDSCRVKAKVHQSGPGLDLLKVVLVRCCLFVCLLLTPAPGVQGPGQTADRPSWQRKWGELLQTGHCQGVPGPGGGQLHSYWLHSLRSGPARNLSVFGWFPE